MLQSNVEFGDEICLKIFIVLYSFPYFEALI